MNDHENETPRAPYLCLKTGSEIQYFELDSDSNSLVGAGGHCKIQLEGDDIRSLHCILAMKEDGCLEVRDWNTGSTFINGDVVTGPTMMSESDLLSIGEYEITVVFASAIGDGDAVSEPTAESELTKDSSDESVPEQDEFPDYWSRTVVPLKSEQNIEADGDQPIAIEPLAGQVAVEEIEEDAMAPVAVDESVVADESSSAGEVLTDGETASDPVPTSAWDDVDESQSTSDPAVPTVDSETHSDEVTTIKDQYANDSSAIVVEQEVEASADSVLSEDQLPCPETASEAAPAVEFVYDFDADFEEEDSDVSIGFAAPEFADALLIDADEVQILRMEVEQLRFELAQRDSEAQQSDEQLSRDQTLRLVSRLEELLEELKQSDVRTRDMEELLRAADQATEDEQEERQQIERWVSELESRVNQRESETEAELQQVKKRLEEARETQQKSNDCLRSVIETRTRGGDSAPNDLEKQVESLQGQLKAAQDEANDLREQLEQRSMSSNTESELRESEQKLAEMQLEASRERAEVSRQRVELQRLKIDLEQQLAPREANVADTRIRAMREHLKELHDKEELEKAAKRENNSGLANRIASLLQRVKGE